MSLQAMAPKKLLSKRARKHPAREGSSAAPQADIEFDGHCFRSEEHQHRFEAIKSWSFLKERRVQLREGEYTEDHTSKTPSGPRKVQQSTGFSALIIGTITGAGPTAAASHRCTIATSTTATIPRVHLSSHVEDGTLSHQDPNPYAWPTPEQLEATVAWLGDRPNFQAVAGPRRAPRDEDGAFEDDDMADVMDFFL
ncbi:hypothetical protein HKD37_02G004605 [Glycine soja]